MYSHLAASRHDQRDHCSCCASGLTESGDWGESVDPFSLKNKTLNDESMPLPLPGLSSDGEEADAHLEHSSEPALFTEKMVSGRHQNHTIKRSLYR